MLTPDAGRLPLPPDDTVLHHFIDELARLVRAEANEATRQIEHLWSQPLLKRVATGRAIDAVTIVKVHPDGLVELRCHRNESRFREGDMLCLSRGDPFAEPNFLVTLELDEETDLLVSTDAPGITAFDFVAQPDGWVLDEGYLNVSDYILEALDEAADTAAGRERVLPLLTGQIRPSLDLERLRAEFGTAHVTHPKEGVQPEQIRVCQLGSATGLESPIVFLVGIHRLLEAEGSLRLSEEERAEQIRDNTRKLYMAMTRAGQRLVVTYVGKVPSALEAPRT